MVGLHAQVGLLVYYSRGIRMQKATLPMARTRRSVRRPGYLVEPFFLSLQHRNGHGQLGVGMGSVHDPRPRWEVPQIARNALLLASDFVSWQFTSYIGLASHTARQRVAQILVTLARTVGRETPGGVALHITNEDLANAANVTPFAASRLISE